jgi:hypothetical protein
MHRTLRLDEITELWLSQAGWMLEAVAGCDC